MVELTAARLRTRRYVRIFARLNQEGWTKDRVKTWLKMDRYFGAAVRNFKKRGWLVVDHERLHLTAAGLAQAQAMYPQFHPVAFIGHPMFEYQEIFDFPVQGHLRSHGTDQPEMVMEYLADTDGTTTEIFEDRLVAHYYRQAKGIEETTGIKLHNTVEAVPVTPEPDAEPVSYAGLFK